MKKNIQEEREKEYIALCKRRDEINQIMRKLPWRKLDKPIQDGWTINMRLIDEAMRRNDGERMAKALALTDEDFKVSSSKSGKITQIRKNAILPKIRPYFMFADWEGKMCYNGPYPKALSEKQYLKIDPLLVKYFTERVHVHTSRWGGQLHVTRTYLLNIPEYYIGIKVKKRMLTMVKDINPELLSEEAWIDDKLQPYYLSIPGSSDKRWRNIDWGPNKTRRHLKDAITHVKKGELEEVTNYKKLKHRL